MKNKFDKGYIVCQPGWEYNDEVYYRMSDDAISDSLGKIYLDKEEAQKEVDELSISNWSNINLLEYGYGVEDFLIDEKEWGADKLKIFIEEIGGKIVDEWDWRTPATMKIEDIRFIEEKTYLSFAYLQELDII